jgi:hypothetical protein
MLSPGKGDGIIVARKSRDASESWSGPGEGVFFDEETSWRKD